MGTADTLFVTCRSLSWWQERRGTYRFMPVEMFVGAQSAHVVASACVIAVLFAWERCIAFRQESCCSRSFSCSSHQKKSCSLWSAPSNIRTRVTRTPNMVRGQPPHKGAHFEKDRTPGMPGINNEQNKPNNESRLRHRPTIFGPVYVDRGVATGAVATLMRCRSCSTYTPTSLQD